MDWLAQVARDYGILIAAALWFVYSQIWPWLRDRWYPDHIKSAADERRYVRRREDHVIDVVKDNTTAMIALTVAISSQQRTLELINQTTSAGHTLITQQISAQATMLTTILENIAGLYGAAGLNRPSYAALAPQISAIVESQEQK